MSTLLAIDPGLTGTGWARFYDGLLVEAGAIAPPRVGDLIQRCASVCDRVPYLWRSDVRLVIELPRTYGGRAAKGDANDLISLAVLVGMLARPGRTALVSAGWQRGAPKAAVAAHARRALTSVERGTLDRALAAEKNAKRRTDIEDAAALGLHYLARL